MARIGESLFALLFALDILLCTVWLAVLYPLHLADKPTGQQLVSSYVGKAKLNGTRWGKIMAAVIDWGATLLGDSPDHCVRTYLKYGA